MNRTDELLNKYIDGELLEGELGEVQLLLKADENVKRLKALQAVDNSLRTLENDIAPVGITFKIMSKLSESTSKIKLAKNYYATTINLIFLCGLVAFLIFAFSQVHWNFSNTAVDGKINETVNSVKENIFSHLSFFKNKNVMFFGSFLSLILLLGAYYSVEAHKAFKKRIENLTSK